MPPISKPEPDTVSLPFQIPVPQVAISLEFIKGEPFLGYSIALLDGYRLFIPEKVMKQCFVLPAKDYASDFKA